MTHLTLTCQCGACEIEVLDSSVRYRAECLCFDCRQRAMISSGMGNLKAFPESLANYSCGSDILYFANLLRVSEQTKAKLEFRKLRESGSNVTTYARCCGTIMLSAHPAYDGKSITVFPDNCRISQSLVDVPTNAYLFALDFPQEKFRELKMHGLIPAIFSGDESLDAVELPKFMAAAQAAIDEVWLAQPHTTYEALYADVQIVVSDDLFADSRQQY